MAQRKPRRPSADLPPLVRQDGALCATFVNTASRQRASLRTYDDLLAWGQRNGVLTAADGQRLARAAGERADAAAAVVRRALDLHALIERILEALIARRTPEVADLEVLNENLGEALATRRLVPAAGGGYRLAWGDRGGDDLDRMLWPVVQSAVDVLTSKYHRKVRRCAGQDCDLLFVDRTPGSPRKWCSMKTCGTCSGSRKHYRKTVKPRREAWRRQRAASRATRRPERDSEHASHQTEGRADSLKSQGGKSTPDLKS